MASHKFSSFAVGKHGFACLPLTDENTTVRGDPFDSVKQVFFSWDEEEKEYVKKEFEGECGNCTYVKRLDKDGQLLKRPIVLSWHGPATQQIGMASNWLNRKAIFRNGVVISTPNIVLGAGLRWIGDGDVIYVAVGHSNGIEFYRQQQAGSTAWQSLGVYTLPPSIFTQIGPPDILGSYFNKEGYEYSVDSRVFFNESCTEAATLLTIKQRIARKYNNLDEYIWGSIAHVYQIFFDRPALTERLMVSLGVDGISTTLIKNAQFGISRDISYFYFDSEPDHQRSGLDIHCLLSYEIALGYVADVLRIATYEETVELHSIRTIPYDEYTGFFSSTIVPYATYHASTKIITNYGRELRFEDKTVPYFRIYIDRNSLEITDNKLLLIDLTNDVFIYFKSLDQAYPPIAYSPDPVSGISMPSTAGFPLYELILSHKNTSQALATTWFDLRDTTEFYTANDYRVADTTPFFPNGPDNDYFNTYPIFSGIWATKPAQVALTHIVQRIFTNYAVDHQGNIFFSTVYLEKMTFDDLLKVMQEQELTMGTDPDNILYRYVSHLTHDNPVEFFELTGNNPRFDKIGVV